MWLLKGCTGCGGDVLADRDEHGWYQECLQCGWMADYSVAAEARESPRRQRRVRWRELRCLAPATKDGKLWLVPCPRGQAAQPEDANQEPLPGGPLDVPWLQYIRGCFVRGKCCPIGSKRHEMKHGNRSKKEGGVIAKQADGSRLHQMSNYQGLGSAHFVPAKATSDLTTVYLRDTVVAAKPVDRSERVLIA